VVATDADAVRTSPWARCARTSPRSVVPQSPLIFRWPLAGPFGQLPPLPDPLPMRRRPLRPPRPFPPAVGQLHAAPGSSPPPSATFCPLPQLPGPLAMRSLQLVTSRPFPPGEVQLNVAAGCSLTPSVKPSWRPWRWLLILAWPKGPKGTTVFDVGLASPQ